MSIIVSDAFGDQIPRFFNQNVDYLQSELQTYVDLMGERLREANHLEEDYHYNLEEPGTSEILVYGRIYAGYDEDDRSERFNLAHAEIHFTPKFTLERKFLKFDIPKERIGSR